MVNSFVDTLQSLNPTTPFWGKILLTVISYLNILIFVVVAVVILFSYIRNIQGIGRRKQLLYIFLSLLSHIILYHDFMVIVWFGKAEPYWIRWAWIFYFVGFPLTCIPVILRSWRLICMYRNTLNWNCTVNYCLTKRVRDDKWMIKRIIILLLPFIILYPFMYLSLYVDYGILPLQLILLTINFFLSVVLFTLRSEMKALHLNESKSLIIFSLLLYVYFIYDNINFYVLQQFEVGRYLFNYFIYILLYNLLFFSLIFGTVVAVLKRKMEEIKKKKEKKQGLLDEQEKPLMEEDDDDDDED